MAKKVELIVFGCRQCPYCCDTYGLEEDGKESIFYCGKGRNGNNSPELKDLSIIPDWCRLPDAWASVGS